MSKVSHEEARRQVVAGRAVHFVPEGHRSRRVERNKKGEPVGMPHEGEKGEFVSLYDELGRLTHAGMELIIREGGSVLYGANIIDRVEDLPGEEQLAQGDTAKELELTSKIDAEIAALQSRRAKISQPKQQPAPSDQERAEFEAWKRQRDQPPPMPPAEEVPTAQPVEGEDWDAKQRRLAQESAAEVEQEEQGRRRKR